MTHGKGCFEHESLKVIVSKHLMHFSLKKDNFFLMIQSDGKILNSVTLMLNICGILLNIHQSTMEL